MTITASQVKELREKTSAGMLDCKKALTETSGDFDQAIQWLRTKGLSKAAKKSGRIAAEGMVDAYIHAGGQVGVLVEVNSETDFVARNDTFKAFVKEIGMHIAAMSPQFISMDEIPQAERDKEKEILKAKCLEDGKKAEFVDKIVDGQLNKWAADICLLEQKFVKDPSKTVQEHLKETIAHLGENLVIRKFVRFELGEGIEKKQENFADEVAAQLKG